MSIKPQELPYTQPFDLDVKQPNKTKKIVLLDKSLFNTDPRLNKEQFAFNIFQSNIISRPKQFEPNFNKNFSAGAFDRKLIAIDIRI